MPARVARCGEWFNRRVFESLDFIYTPVDDVDAEARAWVDAFGGELVWRVRAFGAVVACVRVVDVGPLILLADHLDGDVPILVYRVGDFRSAVDHLRGRGLDVDEFEIPHGPCATFRAAGAQRLAVYELTRPEAAHRFDGRFDD